MITNRKVPIQNIFYMLAYVWGWGKDNIINESITNDYGNLDNFSSSNILALIYLKSVKKYLGHGIYKEYEIITEELREIRGKINFKESLNNLSFQNAKTYCEYDNFEENNLINKIIKTTAYRIHKMKYLTENLKLKLNQILLRFNKVDIINLEEKDFDFQFNRNNYYTSSIIKICELVNSMTMISETKGTYKFYNVYEDENKFAFLFEKFIASFYKVHEKVIGMKASSQKQIYWDLIGENDYWLPRMELDILLENEQESIIVDTKYTENFYKNDVRFSTKKLDSSHLYQMTSYILNFDKNKRTSGILLYPESYTKESVDLTYKLNNVVKQDELSQIRIKTISLNQHWEKIEDELLNIIKSN